MSLIPLRWYYRFQRDFVEKIEYDSGTNRFIFTQRSFFGAFKAKQIPVQNVLYTDDELLNKAEINYINTETLETYNIMYKNAWINKPLFSYLLRQNIQTGVYDSKRTTS